ncbi:MAG: NifB/NifX family molybdenum-iron cluster-binding protein [Clostridia bacterium]|nr:NifB/NifX family molybdenum-iron cluster-binding protein [Clostridia bacterium]
MRIAVTFKDNQIFNHFGHTQYFKIYDVENNFITNSFILPTDGAGHGALKDFLKMNNVDIVICGGIGSGAQNALKEAGITFFGGVTGSADDAVMAYLDKKLIFDPFVKCNHSHDHNHSCESGTCK